MSSKRLEVVRRVERCCQIVRRWRIGSRGERRLVGTVHGVRIGAEVMVERNVLAEDHDQVLDRRLRSQALRGCCRVLCGRVLILRAAAAGDERSQA